ncbi:MAG: hypothetical protein GX640_19585 [Fibrobacter sp.]|nr:hypothetical protein [Fibrobacter sp.]
MKKKLVACSILMVINCGLFSPREIPEPVNQGNIHLYDQLNLKQIFLAAKLSPPNYPDITDYFSEKFRYSDINSGENEYNSNELINKFNLLRGQYGDFSVSWNDSMLYSNSSGDTLWFSLRYVVSIPDNASSRGRADFVVINCTRPQKKIDLWRDLPDNADGYSFFSPKR